MSSESSQKGSSFLRRHKYILLLIAVHVPFLVPYFQGLWNLRHYQFFPFALIAFAGLFHSRRDKSEERWTKISWALVGLDGLCLAVQAVQFSPWLAFVGLVSSLTGWVLANRDQGYARSLLYLSILPLLVIRLPLGYDEKVIHWLQRVTTSVASNLLHRLDMLHFREGNILQFPGKTFLVEEACSGVQSVFTILFVAALVICLKRRSLIHGVLLLSAGLFFSGGMNVLRVITIAVAWEKYATDLSSGIAHDVLGYLCLAIASVLLMSADEFWRFLLGPVPLLPQSGPVASPPNRLIRLWNELIAIVPAGSARAARTSTARVQDADEVEASLFELLIHPAKCFRQLLELLESWFFSRSYGRLMGGTAFLAVTTGSFLLIWWLRHSADTSVVLAYEAAFNQAVKVGDTGRQELFLKSLSSLRRSEPQYQFRVAQFMLQNGRFGEGLSLMLQLAPDSGPDYADARIWLVRQAMSSKAIKPMTMDEIEKQLHVVLAQNPHHSECHQLMALVYTKRKEWKLAEQHLISAASANPALNLDLARLKKGLNRSEEDIHAAAEKAVGTLTKTLEADRGNCAVRISLAEAMMLAGNEMAARELLVSGLEQEASDESLKNAVSSFDMTLVDRRLMESPLNRDACVPVVLQAIQRAPSNVSAVQGLLRLQTMGATISPEDLKSAREYWQTVIDGKPDDLQARVVASQVFLASNDQAAAAETLRPAADQRPELRGALALLLLKCEKSDEGTAILETLIQEGTAKLAESPTDLKSLAQTAEAELALGRVEEARGRLMVTASDENTSRIPTDPGIAALYGRACLACFDKFTGYKANPADPVSLNQLTGTLPENVSNADLLALLTDAAECATTVNSAIDRLSKLSLSSHPAAADAEQVLRQVRLEGTYGAQVLNLLGMHALLVKHYDKARHYLEQANAQTRGRDPMILNNLAVASIRGSVDPKERALKHANEALKLLPDQPEVLATRGEIYVAMEQWSDAIADLTQTLKVQKNNAALHRLLEQAYRGLDDPEMAEEHGQRAAELEAVLSAR